MSITIAATMLLAVAVLGYIWWLELPRSWKNKPFQMRFCPGCRAKLVMGEVDGKQRLHCSCCSFVHWDNPKPVAITLIPMGEGFVMIRRLRNPRAGKIALPGGYVEQKESPEAGAIREALEETGLVIEIDRKLDVIMPPGVNEHLHFFLAKPALGTPIAGDDASDVMVIKKDAVPIDDVAFPTHRKIIEDWLKETA
ncbi:MAG TPA: NUDIX domain-containing protein [Candidatus Obscuribacterales bacterium]